eukprot:4907276-Prymnesium_polylepis.1
MHRRRPCTREGASRARTRCARSSRTRSLRRQRHQKNRTHAARSQLWRQSEVCGVLCGRQPGPAVPDLRRGEQRWPKLER